MISILLFSFTLLPPIAHATAYRLAPCEVHLFGRELATAEAEPEHLVQVMIALWPRSRAIFDRLDATYRRGWQRIGVPDGMGESVLAHTFNVVRAVRIAARLDPRMDVRRALWMALIHDFPEYLVPDFTPHDGISADEKFQREHYAMNEIVEWLGEDARWFEALWLDFERGQSLEARLVHQLDALDIIPSACAYERHGFDVSGFFANIGPRITDPRLSRVFEDVMGLRSKDYVDFRDRYFEELGRR